MSDTVFFLVLGVSAVLCYVVGDRDWWGWIALLAALVVGFRIQAATGSVVWGILAAIAAGGACAVIAFIGMLRSSAARERRRMLALYEQTPEAQEASLDMVRSLWSYGTLNGSEAQSHKAGHLLESLSSRIERRPDFAIDRPKARRLLSGLETSQPNAAFAVLYSLAASTTRWDSRIYSHEADAHAVELWRANEDFFLSQNHKPRERMLIKVLMFHYLDLLKKTGAAAGD